MKEQLMEILEEEQIYVLSLEEAAKKTENKAIIDRAEGVKLYFNRIAERITKEIVDACSTSDD